MAEVPADLNITPLGTADAVAVQGLVLKCAPLTLHSPYTYWVILEYGGYLSRGAWAGDVLVAVVLVVPVAADGVLVWQLGVDPRFRGRGVAGALLRAAWDERPPWVIHIETTIAPANIASRRSFAGLASARGLEMNEVGAADVRGPNGNVTECETRYRLG